MDNTERIAEERLTQGLEVWNKKLSAQQLEQLRKYYEKLVKWNEVMNLTAITEEMDVYEKHFLDSLSILEVLKEQEGSSSALRMIDVGTGAGFPGMVLAIAFPDWQVTLMDSLNKRIRFLEDTAAVLGLTNVVCIHARAEELGHNRSHREQYDLAVSRAVANLNVLSEYCLPFVKTGGDFIAYKSEKIREEVSALGSAAKILGAEPVQVREFTLPGTEYHRALAVLHKKKQTPAKYPRKAGLPAKEPLH